MRTLVEPVALGAGQRLFDSPAALDLMSAKTYACGVTRLVYQPVRTREISGGRTQIAKPAIKSAVIGMSLRFAPAGSRAVRLASDRLAFKIF
jgi:hypothetical protein